MLSLLPPPVRGIEPSNVKHPKLLEVRPLLEPRPVSSHTEVWGSKRSIRDRTQTPVLFSNGWDISSHREHGDIWVCGLRKRQRWSSQTTHSRDTCQRPQAPTNTFAYLPHTCIHDVHKYTHILSHKGTHTLTYDYPQKQTQTHISPHICLPSQTHTHLPT